MDELDYKTKHFEFYYFQLANVTSIQMFRKETQCLFKDTRFGLISTCTALQSSQTINACLSDGLGRTAFS